MQQKLICEHEADWVDALHEEIEAIRSRWPNVSVVALIDCAFDERMHAAIAKHQLPSRGLYDLSGKPSAKLLAVSPTLLALEPGVTRGWRDILELTNGWPMLSIIVTPESLDQLALRLSPWCIVNADGQPYVFRFPDTRRMPAIVDVLTPKQHGAFFGPALAWRYRTRSAQWAELPLPATPLPAAAQVKLDAQQCMQLISDSEADEIIADLHVNDPMLMQRQHPASAYQLVTYALARADFYGIADADRTRWCRMVLQHPMLEHIPAVIPLLGVLRSKESAYADIENELEQLART